jgi:hypothetical protein
MILSFQILPSSSLQAQAMLYSKEIEKASLNNQLYNIAITAYRNLLDETAEET